jgi:hypothetical protein
MIYHLKSVLGTALLIILCHFAFSQSQLPDSALNCSIIGKITFIEPPACDKLAEYFEHDVRNKTIILFLQSGEAPIRYASDEAFENKYGVHFDDFGCVGMQDYACIVKYNYMVFDYLTTRFGKTWRKEIRKDIIGLKQWKPKKD